MARFIQTVCKGISLNETNIWWSTVQRCKRAASFGHLSHVTHLGICRRMSGWAAASCRWLAAVTLLEGGICPTHTHLPSSPASSMPSQPTQPGSKAGSDGSPSFAVSPAPTSTNCEHLSIGEPSLQNQWQLKLTSAKVISS